MIDRSKVYINDINVINLIKNNSKVISISTISKYDELNHVLEIVVNSKDIFMELIKNGIKLSSGEIIKVKCYMEVEKSNQSEFHQKLREKYIPTDEDWIKEQASYLNS